MSITSRYITRRAVFVGGLASVASLGAVSVMDTSAQAAPKHMSAEERRDFHLSEFKRACEELDPMIRHWTDMSRTDACGGGTVSFRISGQYEGDGTYESGHGDVFGRRGRWQVTLRVNDLIDGERTFTVECPGERMVLVEQRLETFIGRKLD